MDRERIRLVITELFLPNGRLHHYREQYSIEVVEAFCNDRADGLAEAVIREIERKFADHASIPDMTPSGPQTPEPPVDLRDDNGEPNPGNPGPPIQSCGAPTEVGDSTNVPAALAGVSVGAKTTDAAPPTAERQAVTLVDAKSTPVAPTPPSPITKTGTQMPRKFSFRLKGGKLQVGVPYDGRIEAFDGAPGAVAQVLSVQLPPELGLASDEADPAHLMGTPKTSGDVTIPFTYRIDAEGSDKIALTSSVSVYINHDPKSLWKDLASDKQDPQWKPDTDSDFLDLPERRLVAASKRGRSHAHEGKFRDDDFRIARCESSGWVIVAVADGAGSAAKSRLGSKIAVGKAVDVLLEKLNGAEGAKLEESLAGWKRGDVSKEAVVSGGLYPVLGIAAFEACKALEAEASALGVPVKELSTTLLVTAYKSTDSGHLFSTYWVGDGGAGVYLKDGSVHLLGKVDSGEFAGQTRFLDSKVMTTEEIANRLNFAVVDDFTALIAMTDGITDPWFTTDNNLESGEYWGKLWAEIDPALTAERPAEALLAWLDFWSAGNHDDRTIAVLW